MRGRRWRVFAATLAVLLVGPLLGTLPTANAALGSARLDLKVLVINGASGELGAGQVDALVVAMDRQGIPYSRVPGTTAITPGLLEDTSGATAHGKFQAVIVPNSTPAGLDATETAVLAEYERAYGVRQIDANVDPTARGVGLQNVTQGPLDGLVATVSPAALVAGQPFTYLDGPVPIDNNDATGQESFGFFANVSVTAPQTFTPLVTTSGPLLANAPLVGVFGDSGREELVITGAYNQNQQWFQTIAHGLLTWVTRGVHLGYDRNYFSVDVDDVFLADGRWSATGHCTPGDEACNATTTEIRMVPADVTKLVTWQTANNFRMNMVFNGGGSDLWKSGQNPVATTDPLVTAFTGPTAANFDWVNHTLTHPYLGCIQISAPAVGQPWHCAVDANDGPTLRQDPTIPGEQSGTTYWASQQFLTSQIGDNIAWATAAGLPNFDRSELVTGEHSGLKSLPWQSVDSPFLGPALTANGIAYTASDHSREPDQRVVTGAATRTVPRHPMNIYYNAGTYQDEVSEYNWIYTSVADGGSGICTANPATSTCIAPLAAGDNAAAQASFNAYIKPLEVRIALSHVLTNDPAPHYAHQSNIAEDGILYPVVEGVLAGYRAMFADNAPIVDPSQTQAGVVLGRAAAWKASAASTTAYLDATGVHVTGGSAGLQVPVTVPTGSTGATLGAYAGELSGWNPAPVNLTVPDVGYLPGPRPAAPTQVTGVAGNRSATVAWTAPAVPVGRSSATGYRITAFVGSRAQAPVDTGNVTKFAVDGLNNGTTYRFTVAARNKWGVGPASAASAAVTPSAAAAAAGGGVSTAPRTTIGKVPRLTLKSKATFSWTTRNISGVTGYRVFVRRAAFGKALPAKWNLLRTVTARSTAISMSPGESLVVAVRPVAPGQSATRSAPSAAVSMPLGARSMKTSKGWSTVSKRSYFGGAAVGSTRNGASLRLPQTTKVRQFAMLAAVGKRGGSVNVFVGGRRVATVSLVAKKAAGQKVLFFRPSQVRSGKVVLKVGSANRLVRIQGLAVLH